MLVHCATNVGLWFGTAVVIAVEDCDQERLCGYILICGPPMGEYLRCFVVRSERYNCRSVVDGLRYLRTLRRVPNALRKSAFRVL
jgi:hypothetical protein